MDCNTCGHTGITSSEYWSCRHPACPEIHGNQKDELKGLHSPELFHEMNPSYPDFSKDQIEIYKNDPVKFVKDIFGIEPKQWQIDCLNAVVAASKPSIQRPYFKMKKFE